MSILLFKILIDREKTCNKAIVLLELLDFKLNKCILIEFLIRLFWLLKIVLPFFFTLSSTNDYQHDDK